MCYIENSLASLRSLPGDYVCLILSPSSVPGSKQVPRVGQRGDRLHNQYADSNGNVRMYNTHGLKRARYLGEHVCASQAYVHIIMIKA